MNHIKKSFLLIICLWAFVPYGISQNENHDKKNTTIKPFYSVAANFGISTTSEIKYSVFHSSFLVAVENDAAKLSYKTLVYGADFSGGIELKHYFKVGLGLGYFYYKQDDKSLPYGYYPSYGIYAFPDFITTHGIPLFLFIRSDFLDKKTSPYIDFKIGNNFLITKEAVDLRDLAGLLYRVEYGKFRLKNGLFLASNIGVAFKMKSKTTLNLSIGYRYISKGYDLTVPQIDGYNEKITYNKTGYITVDHQFVLNLGVSFCKYPQKSYNLKM